jgi:oligosaccharyl transferase (archaeosortase A-associated)
VPDSPIVFEPDATHSGWTARQAASVVAVIVMGAFALRVFLTWPAVFGQDYVAFWENDAWYHMRLVDALVRNFPWRIWYDPYLVHPGGEPVNAGPVLDWVVAGVALVLGAGSPSSRLVDVVGAYVPPVLGSLTVVPIYVLGRELFSRRAGLWAGVMAAVMPGQLLQRSLLGYTDHHCVEVLLSTTAVMFVVLALNGRLSASRRRASALAAGLALGAYLLTWGGGVVFVAILVLWAVLQQLVDAVRGGESDDVVPVVVPVLLIAAVMVTPWAGTRPQFTYQLVSLVGGAVAIWALYFSRRVARRRAWGGATWVAAVAGVACVLAAIALIVAGGSLSSLASDALRVSPFRPRGFISEAQPLIKSELWHPIPLWKEFTSSLVLAVLGAGMLIGPAVAGQRSPRLALLGWWTATMVAATFGQVRFTYYLAVNVALLGGFACDLILRATRTIRAHAANRTLVTCLMGCLLIAPGVPILSHFRGESAALTDDWYDALTWLGANTPEPFPNPEEYYRTGPSDSAVAAYGVLALWDYGYWIARVARRVPVTNPRQTGVRDASAFLLATNEPDANKVIERLQARYIAVDWRLQATSTWAGAQDGVFGGIALAAGRNPFDYCGLYSDPAASTGTLGKLVWYCYPEYYRTMVMRLYLYGGRAAAVEGPVVVLSHRREVRDHALVKVVTGEWSFASYEEASRFVTSSGRSDVRIVSKHPHSTCVPLEPLASYKSAYRTLNREGTGPSAPPVVQLFEYLPHRQPLLRGRDE